MKAFTYRPPFRHARMWRTHDIQRALSYVAVAVSLFLVEMPPRRLVVVQLGIVAILAFVFHRLARRRSDLAYAGAIPDLVAAPAIATLASGSIAVGLGTALVVFAAIVGVFERKTPISAAFAAAGTSAAALAGLVGDEVQIVGDGPTTAVIGVLVAGLVGGSVTTGLWWRLRVRLDERERELATVLMATPVVIGTLSRSGRLVSLSGDSHGLLTGERSNEHLRTLRNLAVGAEGQPVEGRIESQGRVLRVTVVPGHDITTFAGFDATELETANAGLARALAQRDHLLTTVSHELRTPLASVVGFAALLREGLEEDDEHHEMARIVAGQSSDMAAIVDDLLVAARDDGGLVVSRGRVELHGIASLSASALDQRDTAIVTEVEPAVAAGDVIRVSQIVRNLLTNAVRYGGPEIVVRTGTNDGAAFVEVADSGAPIPAEVVETMFDAYVSSRTPAPGAVGIGLAVSRRLAEAMGGSLGYRHENGWSIFRLELAVWAPEAQDGPDTSSTVIDGASPSL
ncbi:MAG: HAMP domain-containing histidine kinase [Acidimicrobiia bacterium]|nr:HAMP domain-containing histidine kinase [Acidimicrobiia bacterium]MDH4309788.1 HAMP domain-containing histidine kinase [Acidimicrobiia bacterium]MDH5292575.1 HAMP domain-containing histidine kinase [Acidimicrobiia bacterium]